MKNILAKIRKMLSKSGRREMRAIEMHKVDKLESPELSSIELSGRGSVSSFKLIGGSAVGTMAVMGMIFMGVAIAANDEDSQQTREETIIQAATGEKTLKWSHVFGDQPGKDMYFKIYQDVLVDPEKEVLKQSAEETGMSENDLRLVTQGNISPIVSRNPGLTVDKAFEKLVQMQNDYNEKLAVTRMKKDLESQVQPSEMFSNGKTSDSGFDLLVDLDRIEKILFDTSTPTGIGGNLLINNTGVAGRSAIKPDTGDESSNGPNTQSGSDGQNNGKSGSSKGTSNGIDSGIDPNTCLVDTSLDDALNKLKQDAQKDPRLRNRTGNADGSIDSENNSDDSNSNNNGSNNDSDDQIKAPDAAQWQNPAFCNDVFCLEVDAKFKTATATPPKADCVACHVRSINAAMKNLLSKSLLPGKLSGNLAEPAKCKGPAAQSFTSLNMNVVLIPNPVKGPGNNDLVVGTPIDDQWQKFQDRFIGGGKTTAKNQADNLKKAPVSQEDKVTQKTTTDAPANADLNTVYKQVNETLARIEANRQLALKDLATAANIDNSAQHFQAMRYELTTMVSYFQSYQKIFQDILSSCNALSGKKACK